MSFNYEAAYVNVILCCFSPALLVAIDFKFIYYFIKTNFMPNYITISCLSLDQ